MNVLAIGSDRSLFQPHSESAARQIAYGTRFENFDIIVFSLRSQQLSPMTLSTGVHAYPTASRSRLVYMWDAFRIGRRLKRPDVITVQDPFESGLVGVLLSRWHGVPLHVQVHTDLYAPAFAHTLLNRVRLMLAPFVFRRAARIRVVSERIRRSIIERVHPRADISVLPIFVDCAKYRDAKPGILADRFNGFTSKILIVSRLEPEKNVALAITSFKKAAPEGTCLIIVGDGSERQQLEAMATPEIFFEGSQDPAPYYALADVVLVTSLYEGYGRTIIEALAAGKPVVSTDAGIAREVGAIVATSEKFADALARWFAEGTREEKLLHYPYGSLDEYVDAYCEDVCSTANIDSHS